MIKAKMYKQIQKLKRQGYLKGEISAKLELDPRTVAKYFGMSERVFKSYHQDKLFRDKELEKYEEKRAGELLILINESATGSS